MFPDIRFPFLTNSWIVVIIFLITLVIFHIVLVVWLKMGETAWKVVDYIWLGFAALGLIGAASQARQIVATASAAIMEARVNVAYTPLRSLVEMYANQGVVCRIFVRSQFSPPPEEFDRTQREFDSVCQWFKKVAVTFPQRIETTTEEIRLSSFPAEPSVTQGGLKDILGGFHRQLDFYNAAAKQNMEVQLATKRSEAEEELILWSPLLLSFALALRITKVSGELALVKKRN